MTDYIDIDEPSKVIAKSIRDFCPPLHGLRLSTPFMCALVAELPYHRNAATKLAVPVYLTNDFARAATALGTAHLMVGSLPPEPSSVRGMLRLCAPLAQNGWQILCELAPDRIRFGVVASDQTPASLGLVSSDGLQRASPTEDGLVSVSEPSPGVIAIQAPTGAVQFEETPRRVPQEPSAMTNLIAAMTEATDSHEAEAACDQLDSIFSAALANSDGALIAVVQRTWGGGWPCEDAAFPPEPIDLLSLASVGQADEVGLGPTGSSPYTNLVVSMIRSDGIVVFDNAARLRTYRWFVRLAPDELRLPGGARERAYRALHSLVEGGSLVAAFIQSADGTTQFVHANDRANTSRCPALNS